MSRPLNAAAVNEIVLPSLTNASIPQVTHKAIKPCKSPTMQTLPVPSPFADFPFLFGYTFFPRACVCFHPLAKCKSQKGLCIIAQEQVKRKKPKKVSSRRSSNFKRKMKIALPARSRH